MIELVKDIYIIDLALYLDNYKTLVIADSHVGFEEALNKQGILVPRFQFADTIKRLETIFFELKKEGKLIETTIINGDIKHEFGTISEQEWRHTLKLLDFLLKHCGKVILVRGNHDTIIGPIAEKRNVDVVDKIILKDVLILHGDKIFKNINKISKTIKTIIIGHEHPAISICEKSKQEVFKCFLYGKWKGKNLIVQPSFNLVTEGTDVLKEKLISPFLEGADIRNFEVFVIADKVYPFGKIIRFI